MLKTKEKIEHWLNQRGIENYLINQDLTVDVNGHVDLSSLSLKEIPIQFGVIKGNFFCYGNKLTSLRGSPEVVEGDFYCGNNYLTNLDYCPKIIGGGLNITQNEITSLKNFKSHIGGSMYHGCFDDNPYKIMELDSYYKLEHLPNKEKIMVVELSGKELKSILAYIQLQTEIPTQEDKSHKRLKL